MRTTLISIAALLTCALGASSCGPASPSDPFPPSDTGDVGLKGDTDVGADADTGPECIPDCAGKECGDDGCDGECGPCGANEECDAEQQCVSKCEEESREEFCERHGVICGKYSGQNLCGDQRTYDCPNTCDSAELCTAGAGKGSCCKPPADSALCTAFSVACGRLLTTDACGTERDVACPDTCTAPNNDCIDNTCVCPPESDTLFCQRNGKECGTYPYQGLDNCGAPRKVDCAALLGTSCEGTSRCVNHACQPTTAAPGNDGCGEAEPLTLIEGYVEFEVDTRGATKNRQGSCLQSYNNDVVYAIALERPSRLVVEGFPESGVIPYLHLTSECLDHSLTHDLELACSAFTNSNPIKLRAAGVGPGTVYLWIGQGHPASGFGTGKMRVTITAEEQPSPENDSLEQTYELQPTVVAGESLLNIEGSTALASVEPRSNPGACALTSSDVFFPFSLEADVSIHASLIPKAPRNYSDFYWANPWFPGLALLNEAGEERLCDVGPKAGYIEGRTPNQPIAAELFVPLLSAGEAIMLRVGGTLGGGDFALEVSFGAPIYNDICNSSMAPLEFLTSPPTSLTPTAFKSGTTAGATDAFSSPCASANGRDLVYSFVVPEGRDRTVRYSLAPSVLSNYCPIISLRTACDDIDSTLFCARTTKCVRGEEAAPITGGYFGLAPGTYFLVVDSANDELGGERSGYFNLEVELPERGAAPAGDSCGPTTSIALTFDPEGLASESGTNVDARNDLSPSCLPNSGGEVSFHFSVNEPSSFVARVDAAEPSSGYRPALYLVPECAPGTGATACAPNTARRAYTILHAPELAAGSSWYLVVDGADRSEGAFMLQAALLPRADNGTCSTVREVTFSPTELIYTAISDTSFGSASLGSASCGAGSSGRELLWKLNLPNDATYNLKATVTPRPGSALIPTLSLRRNCEEQGSELTCASLDGGKAEASAARRAPGSSWILVVDSAAGSEGLFDLEIALELSGIDWNDLCEDAADLALGDNAIASTANATHDSVAGCRADSTGAELVYLVDLGSAVKTLTITLTPQEAKYVPILYVRSGCGALAEERACRVGGVSSPLVLTLPNVTGKNYLFVDSLEEKEGKFELKVEGVDAGIAPANDTCSTPQSLSLAAPSFRAQVLNATTANARADYRGTCGKVDAPLDGPDLVYKIAVGEPGRLTIRAHTNDVAYSPALYLRSDGQCASLDTHAELACSAESATPGMVTLDAFMAGGNYFLIVDGSSNSAGSFSLDLSLTPLASRLPDSCAAAEPISLPIAPGLLTIPGDTTFAANTLASLKLAKGNGGNLIYRFEVQGSPKHLTATAAFSSFDGEALLYLRKGTCEDALPEEELMASASERGGPVTLQGNLTPAIYYLIVDSVSPLRGAFELRIESDEAPPPQTNATCASATQVLREGAAGTPSIIGSQHLTGSTFGLVGTQSSSTKPTPGGEAIYSVVVPAGKRYTLSTQLTNQSMKPGLALALYLRKSCDSGAAADELAFAEVAAGATKRASISSLIEGTYFIIVDGLSAEGDVYALEVALATGTNMSCAEAEATPLTLTDGKLSFFGFNDASAQNTLASLDACNTSALQRSLPGVENIYKLSIPELPMPADLLITATIDGSTSGAAIILRRTTCTTTAGELCSRVTTGAKAMLRTTLQSPGDYYLWLDSMSATVRTRFDIAVELLPVGGSCEAPIKIELHEDQATLMGDTAIEVDHGHTGCKAASGSDIVYALELDPERLALSAATIELSVQADTSTAMFPVLSLSTDISANCFSEARDPRCALPGTRALPAVLVYQVPMRGQSQYRVIVDSYTPTQSGAFTLHASVRYGAASGDLCPGIPISGLDMSGTNVLRGTLRGASANYQGSCAATNGRDIVYAFTIPAIAGARSLTATMEAMESALLPSLTLRAGSCDSATWADERGCSAPAGGRATLSLHSLAPGNYWLIAGSTTTPPDAKSALFALTLTFDAPTVGIPDLCDPGAEPIAIDSSGRRTLHLPGIELGTHQQEGSCYATKGPDLAFPVMVPANYRLTATLTPEEPPFSSSFAPTLYIRNDCTASPSGELACLNSARRGQPLTLSATRATSGLLYVIVDSEEVGAVGPFQLELSLAPAPRYAANDTCLSPFPDAGKVTFSNGSAVVSGLIDEGSNSSAAPCAVAKGPDRVYELDFATPQHLRVSAVASGFRPVLYLLKRCDEPSSSPSFGCVAPTSANTAALDIHLVPAGKWYLWIDSHAANDTGAYWLDFSLSAPDAFAYAANDDCTLPEKLEFSGTGPFTATTTGDLRFARNDSSRLSVGTSTHQYVWGADLVYSLEIKDGPKSLEASLSEIEANFVSPVLYLRAACTEGDVIGRKGVATGTGKLSHQYLPVGTYFLWVDSVSTAAFGSFRLNVTLTTVAETAKPMNYTCDNLGALDWIAPTPPSTTSTVTLTRNITQATSESFAGGHCLASMAMAEDLYKLELTGTTTLTLKKSSGTAYAYIRTACTDTSRDAEVYCNPNLPTTATSLTLPPGTYFLFIEGGISATAAMAYGVELTKTPAADGSVPPNQTCGDAIALELNRPVMGSTSDAHSTFSKTRSGFQTAPDSLINGCAAYNAGYTATSNGNGPDLVYSYTPKTSALFTVVIDNSRVSTYWAGFVSVNSSCNDANSCVGATLTSNTSAKSVTISPAIPNHTYFIIVDADSSKGQFELYVTTP